MARFLWCVRNVYNSTVNTIPCKIHRINRLYIKSFVIVSIIICRPSHNDAFKTIVYDLGVGTRFDVSSIPGYKNYTSQNFIIDWVNSCDSTDTYLGNSEDASNPAAFYYTYCDTHIFRKGYTANTGILSTYNDGKAVHAFLVVDKSRLASR